MKLIDRYIAKHVIYATLVMLCVLLTLFTVIAFVDDLSSIGKGDYTLIDAIKYIALTTPLRAFNLFPMAALLGALIGLGTLSSNSELTVVRAAGASVVSIVAAAMKGGLVLMVIAVVIGEVLAPIAETQAQHDRSLALSDKIELKDHYGFWARDGRSFVNIRRALPGDRMEDVYIYEFDADNRLRVSTHAKSASFVDGEWRLEDITQSTIAEHEVTARRLDEGRWKTGFDPDLVNVVSVKPESLSIIGLRKYTGYLHDNGLNASRFELALWTKLMYPVATGIMVFLAVPLVLGHLRAVGVGHRILVGALLGIVFHVVNQASGHVGLVYGITPAVSAVLPSFAFCLFGIWMIRQVR